MSESIPISIGLIDVGIEIDGPSHPKNWWSADAFAVILTIPESIS